MAKKTILLIDDELGFLEALEDALLYEGHTVLKASTAEDALLLLAKENIDCATIDIMMPAGRSLDQETSSHTTGIYLCERIRREHPSIDLFCISVVSEPKTIRQIENLGVRFLRKGETPLRTVLDMIRSRLTGVAYSSDREVDKQRRRLK